MLKPITEAEQRAVSGYHINQHPDGQPWPGCCGSKGGTQCQCLMRKPKNSSSRFSWLKDLSTLSRLLAEKGRFFCIHRKDGEYHRECGGWAAKITKNGQKPRRTA